MQRTKLAILVLMTFVIILPLLTSCSGKTSYSSQKVMDGTLDLTQWSSDEEVIKLDGKWEFYWNQFLAPEEFKEVADKMTGYIDVPGTWNHTIVEGKELSGDSFATYRMQFNSEGYDRLGLKLPRIFTSYQLYANGEMIAAAGTTGSSRDAMIPQYLPQVAFFESRTGMNEIVIQVSNYYHRSGGVLESIIMSSDDQILAMRSKNIAYELLIFGSLMIMGVYHIALYFFRKKNMPPLYFGVFCLFVGIRTLLVGERFFIYLVPNFNWEIAHKIQTLTYYFGLPIILMFFMSVYPKYFHPKIIRFVQWVAISFGVLVLLTPAKIFTIFNPAYQIFTLLVIAYIVYRFFIILRHKEKGIELIIIGALVLILTSVNDIVYLSIWMNDHTSIFIRSLIRTGNLTSIGQMVFVFANSLVLARKFSASLEQEEVMTAQLKEINLNLDDLVSKRTEALEESRGKIEDQKQELEKANQALQLLSLKDPLTGLWNRRQYDDTIVSEWNRGLRYQRPLSLMVIDIDFFKEYNDCYGHQAGDQCLERIAQAVKNQLLRASDFAVRYGGDEFVVIMPEFGKDEVIQMGISVREIIEEMNLPHKCSSISPWVTVSVGVTSIIPNKESAPEKLFLAADKALYKAKDAGRNRVEFHM